MLLQLNNQQTPGGIMKNSLIALAFMALPMMASAATVTVANDAKSGVTQVTVELKNANSVSTVTYKSVPLSLIEAAASQLQFDLTAAEGAYTVDMATVAGDKSGEALNGVQ